MTHGYKTLQHWNQWLSQHSLGTNLLAAEEQLFTRLLTKHFGKHAVLIGVPQQTTLLHATAVPYHTLLSPVFHSNEAGYSIESNFQELPLLTGSVDIVILPHTLELIENPQQLVAEACRIIKPEGLIVISGFNPVSTWGLRKLFIKRPHIPWTANFIAAHRIKNWLQLADFALEKHQTTLFRPPVGQKLYKKLHFLETLGHHGLLPGGVYVLLARAKVIPLTPIRLKWKQQLGSIRISTTTI